MSERPFEPRIVERTPEPSIAVHFRVPMTEVDMGAIFGRELPRLWARMIELGGQMGSAPYGRYFDWGHETADFEIGIVLDRSIEALPPLAAVPAGEIGASELPGGPTAVAIHWGSYNGLASTYSRLDAWVTAQGRTTSPGPWESYVDNPDEVADREAVRTEVCYPLG